MTDRLPPLGVVINLGGEDFIAAPRAYSLRQARLILDKLGGGPPTNIEPVPGLEACEECGREALTRYRLGSFVLCSQCVARRAAAGRKATAWPLSRPNGGHVEAEAKDARTTDSASEEDRR